MGKVKAICISERRGTQKSFVKSAAFVTEYGIDGDAHAGDWHRQVSFLGQEVIDAFKARGAKVEAGAFGENIIAEGFTFKELSIGTRLRSGDVFFEITQIGKECHAHCAIYQQVGDCIMPREGVFARVLHGGRITVGDDLELATDNIPLDAAIVTVSDRGFHGLRDEDTSGDKCEELLTAAGYKIYSRAIVPDVKKFIVDKLIELTDAGIGLIVTTGGTGFAIRDITPEATLEVCTRLAPGIPEAMRALSLKVTGRAMLSRAVAGIRKRSLIVNLPGSPKAVDECLSFVLPQLKHGIEILRGETGNCAR
ncbi:MAG: MOSC domain-containing protein [Selenomonadaceae bacterium]|nr:MOSC domain-containing protein [Selenomonadaceae bacterium]